MDEERQIEDLAIDLYNASWSVHYFSKPFWLLWANQGIGEQERFKELAKYILARDKQRDIKSMQEIPDHR